MKLALSLVVQFISSLAIIQGALAAPVAYDLTVDTSPLSGTLGSLDFNFNPGTFGAQLAQAQVSNVSGGTTSGATSITGNVSGDLVNAVLLDNGTPFNDYFQSFLFGSVLNLRISLDGPALTSPDGTSLSGSTFVFSVFQDVAGTIPALSSDAVNGFGYRVDVNVDGTTRVTDYFTTAAAVPEPSTIMLMLPALGAMVLVSRKRRYRRDWRRSKKSR